MKRLLFLAIAMTFVTNNAYAADKSKEGIFDKVKNAVVKVFTGDEGSEDSDSASGNENAIHQIDKNLEKHGGEHKGLENARAAVSKSKHKKGKKHGKHDTSEDGVVDEVSDAIEDEIEDVAEDIKDAAEDVLTGND